MINVVDKKKCCGCNACIDICPKNAISQKIDIEGFWYPNVDTTLCINCGMCNKVCPQENIEVLKKNDFEKPRCIAAINKNLKIRFDSTSGGLFSVLASKIYEQGGFVGGAIYNSDFSVRHFISNNPEDLTKLRSSKYLQSNTLGFYKEVKAALQTGKPVLVCGTPCQMAAMRAFLRKNYENLIIADLICRGVNSPKVYRKYLDSLEKKFNSKVVYVKAKNKELGWRNLTRKVTFENGQSYYGVHMQDDFRRGYHTNVYCRPACYECKFKGFPRMADITLADFWGIEKIDKNLDNNMGTSLVLLNSKKGELFFEEIKDQIEYKETTFESILPGNIALRKPIDLPQINRERFFKDLDENDFDFVVEKYFPLSKRPIPFKRKIKNALKPYFQLYKVLKFNPKSWYTFFWLNFLRKNSETSFKKHQIIYPYSSAVFDIHPTATINVKAPFSYGLNPVKGLKMPTCLKMKEGTTLNIHGGPLTRYGDLPYNLRYGAYIEIVNKGVLTIGQGACNVGLTIICAKEITIGNGVRIGRNVSIRDWNGIHVIVNNHYRNHAPVHIGDHVWLCSGCSIMPGVTIGEGSVVAANSTVTRDVPPKCLVGGSPARILKENIEWY